MKEGGPFNWDLWWDMHTKSHLPKAVRLLIYTVDDLLMRLKFLAGEPYAAEHTESTWVHVIFVKKMPW